MRNGACQPDVGAVHPTGRVTPPSALVGPENDLRYRMFLERAPQNGAVLFYDARERAHSSGHA